MKKTIHPAVSDFHLVEHMCFRLLAVQILLAVIGVINGMISGLFASNYVGADVMSAVGLYNPIRLFICAFGMMMFGGSQILFGKYMGKSQRSEISKIFSLNIVISLAFGIAATVLAAAAAIFDLTAVFTGDEHVRSYFNLYLLGSAIGILPQLLGQQLSGFLSMENRTKITTAASVVCVLSNILFNYLFVVVLSWGAFGVSLATSLSTWLFFAAQIHYYISGKSQVRFRLKGLDFKASTTIFSTGLPSALVNGYMMLRSIVLNALLLAHVGPLGLSAFATCNTLLDIFWAIPNGMCAVCRMLFGIYTGEEDRNTLQNIMRVVLYRFVPITAAVSLVLVLAAGPLAGIYYQDRASEIFMMTVLGFRILPLCIPLGTFSMHYVCYGQTIGKNFLVHLISFADGVLAVLVFAFLLIPSMGFTGLCLSLLINGFACPIIVIFYARLINGRFPRSTEELMVIPKDFGAPEDSRMDITVHSMEDVVTISRRVQDFCIGKGIDGRTAYFAALAVEEMAGNVVEHGFTMDKKPHSSDIRVVCKGDELILRIKDDCQPFNPAKLREVFDPEDPTKNIGIRIVFSMCHDVKYQNLLGMNALTIKV